MSIFKKEKSIANFASLEGYYGNIDIDLLDVNEKVIEKGDVSASDFALMFTNISVDLLTKTQFDKFNVGIICDNGKNAYSPVLSSSDFVLAPVLKFRKPLKEIFKNTLKDEKGRKFVYFSKYPIETVFEVEKENVALYGKETKKKIHFFPK